MRTIKHTNKKTSLLLPTHSGKESPLILMRKILMIFKKILFIHERHREVRGRDIGGGRSRLSAGSPMPHSIPEPGSRLEPKADAQPLSRPDTREKF